MRKPLRYRTFIPLAHFFWLRYYKAPVGSFRERILRRLTNLFDRLAGIG